MLDPVQAPPSLRFSQKIWPAAVIALGALAAYHNTFSVPLLFDDHVSIVENRSIRHLGNLGAVLDPPPDITPSGRPVLNLTLAVNYAISGRDVWSYHVVNLLVHIAAGLTLFGCVHRTLQSPLLRARFGTDARMLGFVAALLWTLHPLQTESVTYIIQRAESLVGLFYLLTFYCYLRSTDSPSAGRWQMLSIASCALGMATKEVMVTAPVMVLLHDRALVAGSFRAAWEQRKRLYLGLEATWAVLGWLVGAGGGNRSGSIGPGVDTPWLDYFLTQFEAVARYLQLSLWPHPLIFDHGWHKVESLGKILPYALVLLPLIGLTLHAFWRRPKPGFLGAWFFGILAVTSLAPGTTQMIVEHRVYLSVAAVVVGLVLVAHSWLGRRAWIPGLAVSLAFGALTVRRNHDYRSALSLWEKTAGQRPDNARAIGSVGQALLNSGRPADAVPYYERAIQLEPGFANKYIELGVALSRANRKDEAVTHFKQAIKLHPTSSDAHRNLGAVYSRMGRVRDALTALDEALRLEPDNADNFIEMGVALGRAGHLPPAIAHFEKALSIDPESAITLNHLGYALMRQGRLAEARARFEQALRLEPEYDAPRHHLEALNAKDAAIGNTKP